MAENGYTGNLSRRKDNIRGIEEDFTYDNLNRLTAFGGNTIAYDDKGNITDMSATGQFAYGTAIALRNQTVTYNGMMRPDSISENGYTATFAYDADGDRAKMLVSRNGTDSLARYYLGGQYELDQTLGATKEKLYLGGDAYSAAAVYVKSGSGSWQVYYLGRDYQGSITHVLDASGGIVQELSYDPWGRLRNPSTLVAYASGSEPTLFLDRGYTGHEHLAVFGLINMNARLYDPALGRFLSPDPYVQAPDFSQNFNRYSYCLNNPLKFTDESGKWFGIDDLISAAVGGTINWVSNGCKFSWEGLAYFGAGAVAGWVTYNTAGLGTYLMSGVLSGANSVISQGFNNGWSNINLGQVFMSGVIGIGTSYAGQQLGNAIAKPLDKALDIQSPLLKQLIIQETTSTAVGTTFGGLSALGSGENFWDGAWKGAKTGFYTGGINAIGTAVQISRDDNVDFFSGKSLKQSPYQKGQSGVEMAITDLKLEGADILGTEVSFDVNGVRTKADLVVEIDNVITLVEVKNGVSAKFTPNQKAAYKAMISGGAKPVPVGANATGAGLTVGQPLNNFGIRIIQYKR